MREGEDPDHALMRLVTPIRRLQRCQEILCKDELALPSPTVLVKARRARVAGFEATQHRMRFETSRGFHAPASSFTPAQVQSFCHLVDDVAEGIAAMRLSSAHRI